MIRLETGAGVVPVELERDGPRIVFGLMDQPLPAWEPVRDGGDPGRGRGRALGAAGRALRPRSGARLLRARVAGGRRRARTRLAALARATPDGANCFARDGSRWKTRMFAPDHGVAEDPATGRPPARSRCISPGTAASPSASRSRSPGHRDRPSLDALRDCLRRRRDDRTRHRRRVGGCRCPGRVQLLALRRCARSAS